MARPASLNFPFEFSASYILTPQSCSMNFGWANFGSRSFDCSHAVNTFRPAQYYVHKSSHCWYTRSSSSGFTCVGDLRFLGLNCLGICHFSSLPLLDASLRYRRGAKSCCSFHGIWKIANCSSCSNNCRWRSRFAAKREKTGFVGEDMRSSVILDFYLIRELLPPLILSTVAFSILGVSIGLGPEVMAIIEKTGLSFRSSLLCTQIFFFRLPSYVALALPMASLLASMLGFGRLGVDSEIIALRAAGIGSLRMLRPTFMLFLTITALHLFLSEGLSPRSNRMAIEAANAAMTRVSSIRDVRNHKITRTSSASFSRPIIYPEYGKHRLKHLLCAQGFDGYRSLLTVTFVQLEGVQNQETAARSSQSALSVKRIVLAEKAIWDEDQRLWIFNNGCEYLLGKVPQSRGFSKEADSQSDRVSLQSVRQFSFEYVSELTRAPLDFAKLGIIKSFEDMTLLEASKLFELMQSSRNVKESRKLQVKIQQRISLPFASIVFGLVGCILSLHLPREQKRVGIALSLVMVFSYYVASVFGSLIAQLGYVSPVLGAWLPNITGAFLALVLLFHSV